MISAFGVEHTGIAKADGDPEQRQRRYVRHPGDAQAAAGATVLAGGVAGRAATVPHRAVKVAGAFTREDSPPVQHQIKVAMKARTIHRRGKLGGAAAIVGGSGLLGVGATNAVGSRLLEHGERRRAQRRAPEDPAALGKSAFGVLSAPVTTGGKARPALGGQHSSAMTIPARSTGKVRARLAPLTSAAAAGA